MAAPDASRSLVSLVFPAYNEVDHANAMIDFFREIEATYPDHRFEMVVVDDGSDDDTADAVIALVAPGEEVRVISLSRRFGSHAAITAGFAHAVGDVAITLTADRSEPLEAVGMFLDQWHSGADIVWGLRSVRAQQKASSMLSRLFSSVFNLLSELSTYPVEGPSQMLVARQVLDTLATLPENNRNLLALVAWTGFDQRRISYPQLPRPHGTSKWTFAMKLKLVVDSFVEFSHAPTVWIAAVGATVTGLGLILLLVSGILALLGLGAPATTAVICGCILLAGGLNLAAVAVVGEYVWRIGADARRRPVYLVRRIVNAGGQRDADDDRR
jgi:dolichol-phosphate mannosyltransferase